MAILIDTQSLVWAATGSSRLSPAAADVLFASDQDLFVSAVTAYEFVDLNCRGRFDGDLPLDLIVRQLEANLLDFPAEAYRLIALLPTDIHRDPVDRMLIAHAIHADLTIVTADAAIRQYPVRTLW